MRRRDYQRNQDDIYTDPSLVSSRYQLGRNAFFEVELALAELDNKSINSSGGGSSSAGVSGGSLGGLGGGGWWYWRGRGILS
jgi:uncharacterized membrane protein